MITAIQIRKTSNRALQSLRQPEQVDHTVYRLLPMLNSSCNINNDLTLFFWAYRKVDLDTGYARAAGASTGRGSNSQYSPAVPAGAQLQHGNTVNTQKLPSAADLLAGKGLDRCAPAGHHELSNTKHLKYLKGTAQTRKIPLSPDQICSAAAFN